MFSMCAHALFSIPALAISYCFSSGLLLVLSTVCVCVCVCVRNNQWNLLYIFQNTSLTPFPLKTNLPHRLNIRHELTYTAFWKSSQLSFLYHHLSKWQICWIFLDLEIKMQEPISVSFSVKCKLFFFSDGWKLFNQFFCTIWWCLTLF